MPVTGYSDARVDVQVASPGSITGIPRMTRWMNRLTALRAERSTWLAHWQELSDFIFPRRFRYLMTDRNKGTKRNDKIINNTPTIAVRTLAAGMMAGLTSPARPWFRLVLSDPALSDDDECKLWLSTVQKIILETFAKSNLYNALHEAYAVEATFATMALYVEEDEKDDVRGYVFPIGQFMVASTAQQRTDTIFREFSMTVGQLVDEFGIEKCSTNVKQFYKDGNLDQWIEVVHLIEPRRDRDPGLRNSKNMPWASIWFEKAADQKDGQVLREMGYEEFPVMIARWFVTGEDMYGSGSPGMDSLGDCKAIQSLERRSARVTENFSNPPMTAPTALRMQRLSMLPGDTNYVPDGQQGVVKPAIETKGDQIKAIEDKIQRHEDRINETFFVKLFKAMLMNQDRQPITAREVEERSEEKMLQLGPVTERNEDELLSPLINRVMRILWRRGRLPPMPRAMLGGQVKVEYISVMAQAQKLLGTASTERFASFVGSVSAVKPEVLDIVNFDKMITEFSKMLGVPPEMINPQRVVEMVRAQRAQQQAQAAQLQQMASMAQSAKVASEADTGGQNALTDLIAASGASGGPIGRA